MWASAAARWASQPCPAAGLSRLCTAAGGPPRRPQVSSSAVAGNALPALAFSLHLRPPLHPQCAVASQRRHLSRLRKVELYPGRWLFFAESHRRLAVIMNRSATVAAVPPAAPGRNDDDVGCGGAWSALQSAVGTTAFPSIRCTIEDEIKG
uniref:Uncharacterized protein n=1 Tax=Oryza rufipogon TaxID=4529 RepID=A0A0E0PYH8_ORYRU